jgi:signal transduction histidine kinase/CheY-like chemotaxis protein
MGHDQPPSSPKSSPPSSLVRELASLRILAESLRDELEELRESQQLLETSRDDYVEIHDRAPLPLLTLGKDGTIRSANLAAAELFAQERSSLILRSFRSFLHDADCARVFEHFGRRSQGARAACEARLLLSDGSVAPVQIWSRASWRRPGVQHITLIDLRERELDAWEKSQLGELARRARAENESKDHVIAMLSHELRTPLTPVLAATSALRNAPALSDELRHVFDVIDRNVTTEARLIDDLLDATGIAQGKLRVVRQPLDVHALLNECVESMRAQAELKGVSLSCVVAAERAFAEVDALRMAQVFTNLLLNALKFTPPGGQVCVRTWNTEQQALAIEVQDDGIGFEPTQAAQLFNAFERLEGARESGLGLGLAIAKGFVELHEGKISASSLGPHRGARFVVELPTVAATATTAAAALPPRPVPRRSGESSVVPRLHILLVEDHADTAYMLRALLEEYGYAVTSADSVQSALAVDLTPIHAIISDLGLPDGSGHELMQKLERTAGQPAIALSGYGMAADIENALKAGFQLHLTKPVDFTRLLEALGSLLGEPAAAEQDTA